MTWKHMACHINKSDPGHTSGHASWVKNDEILATKLLSIRNWNRVEREKKKRTHETAKLFALHASAIKLTFAFCFISRKQCSVILKCFLVWHSSRVKTILMKRIQDLLNSFYVNIPSLYHLKTLENPSETSAFLMRGGIN